MEVHLDPVGGIAGDMFVAALLHAFPEQQGDMLAAIEALRLPGLRGCRVESGQSHNLHGLRFLVEVAGETNKGLSHAENVDEPQHNHKRHRHSHNHDEHHHPLPSPPSLDAATAHPHVTWAQVNGLIGGAPLEVEVKRHALGIFRLLAQAEARAHGVAEDQVAFHEVGATDSIVDIVGASYLIATLQPHGWTIGPLPLGSGRIWSAHGWLPVPTPAAALLLEGFAVHQDGVAGERVTPTGAAIARYLACRPAGRQGARVLWRSGIGLGTRSLPGVSNCLRVLVFSDSPVPPGDAWSGVAATTTENARPREKEAAATANEGEPPELNRRQLVVLEFEVDDQTPEDLAAALDRLRSDAAVYDVVQQAAIGKRGRSAAHVRVLARPDEVEQVARRCFQETSTIGLRYHFVEGFTLTRLVESTLIAGRPIRVKVVARPGTGLSAKAEMEDLAQIEGGHFRRLEVGQLATEQAVNEVRGRQASVQAERATQVPRPAELSHDDDNAQA